MYLIRSASTVVVQTVCVKGPGKEKKGSLLIACNQLVTSGKHPGFNRLHVGHVIPALPIQVPWARQQPLWRWVGPSALCSGLPTWSPWPFSGHWDHHIISPSPSILSQPMASITPSILIIPKPYVQHLSMFLIPEPIAIIFQKHQFLPLSWGEADRSWMLNPDLLLLNCHTNRCGLPGRPQMSPLCKTSVLICTPARFCLALQLSIWTLCKYLELESSKAASILMQSGVGLHTS